MKVLHFPVNYGSLPSHSVRVLRQANVDAYGLTFTQTNMQSASGIKTISDYGASPLTKLMNRVRWFASILYTFTVKRPDIIHWYFGKQALPFGLDLLLVRALKIPRLVEWQGSDIRIPEVEFADNPYFKHVYEGDYEYKAIESYANSRERQLRFKNAGFTSVAPVGMLQYVQKDIFPQTYIVPQRLILDDYEPLYPDAQQRRPLVVHSPTAPVTKGTAYVLEAVERLQQKYDFDFRLITGVSRAEALEIVRQCDVFLDWFALGDRGMASLEAMAFGKPVICYIKPSLAALYPPDNPIINAKPDEIEIALGDLLQHPQKRVEYGKKGRAFVEQHYQPQQIADALVQIYQQVIASS